MGKVQALRKDEHAPAFTRLRELKGHYLYPCKPNWLDKESDLFSRIERDPSWVAEVKKNGWRCLASKEAGALTLWTRHFTTINSPLVELRKVLNSMLPDGTVIDGELIDPRTTTVKGVFYAFDIMWFKRRPMFDLPLYARREILEGVVNPFGPVELATQIVVGSKRKLFENSIDGEANEGIVIKKKSSVYLASPKRCLQHPQWFKVKRIEEHYKTPTGH